MDDFNSHHKSWGYSDNDENCEKIYEWSSHNNLYLVFDAKEIGTIHSGRWNKGYNPDLCFVTRDSEHRPLGTIRTVLPAFPRSQHRPVILNIGLQVPIIPSIPKPRWNFQKGNWANFKLQLDNDIRWIPPVPQNYSRFTNLVISTAKKHIPRGYRKEYIPCWDKESTRLFNLFNKTPNSDIARKLLDSLTSSRNERWLTTVESLDFKFTSR